MKRRTSASLVAEAGTDTSFDFFEDTGFFLNLKKPVQVSGKLHVLHNLLPVFFVRPSAVSFSFEVTEGVAFRTPGRAANLPVALLKKQRLEEESVSQCDVVGVM